MTKEVLLFYGHFYLRNHTKLKLPQSGNPQAFWLFIAGRQLNFQWSHCSIIYNLLTFACLEDSIQIWTYDMKATEKIWKVRSKSFFPPSVTQQCVSLRTCFIFLLDKSLFWNLEKEVQMFDERESGAGLLSLFEWLLELIRLESSHILKLHTSSWCSRLVH